MQIRIKFLCRSASKISMGKTLAPPPLSNNCTRALDVIRACAVASDCASITKCTHGSTRGTPGSGACLLSRAHRANRLAQIIAEREHVLFSPTHMNCVSTEGPNDAKHRNLLIVIADGEHAASSGSVQIAYAVPIRHLTQSRLPALNRVRFRPPRCVVTPFLSFPPPPESSSPNRPHNAATARQSGVARAYTDPERPVLSGPLPR